VQPFPNQDNELDNLRRANPSLAPFMKQRSNIRPKISAFSRQPESFSKPLVAAGLGLPAAGWYFLVCSLLPAEGS
jgi:hypothetical protein